MQTLKELYTDIKAQFASYYQQNVSPLPKSFLDILSKVLAGVVNASNKYANFATKQIFLKTASFEPIKDITDDDGVALSPLIERAQIYGIGQPTLATQAELTVSIFSTATASLPAGVQLTNDATGVIYTTDVSYSLTANSSITITVRASGDTSNNGGYGTIGNLEIGDIIRFIDPQNVSAEATVNGIITVAGDAQTADNYRQEAISAAKQERAPTNTLWYRQEGESVAGVRVYPYTSDTVGEMDIYVKNTASGSVIPQQAQLDDVKQAIVYDENGIVQLPAQTVEANINVLPVETQDYTITIFGLTSDNDLTAIKAEIDAVLQNKFDSYEPYIAEIDVGTVRRDIIARDDIAGDIYSVVESANATLGTFIISKDGSEISQDQLDKKTLAILVSVSYV
jgi:hypothetical protein